MQLGFLKSLNSRWSLGMSLGCFKGHIWFIEEELWGSLKELIHELWPGFWLEICDSVPDLLLWSISCPSLFSTIKCNNSFTPVYHFHRRNIPYLWIEIWIIFSTCRSFNSSCPAEHVLTPPASWSFISLNSHGLRFATEIWIWILSSGLCYPPAPREENNLKVMLIPLGWFILTSIGKASDELTSLYNNKEHLLYSFFSTTFGLWTPFAVC